MDRKNVPEEEDSKWWKGIKYVASRGRRNSYAADAVEIAEPVKINVDSRKTSEESDHEPHKETLQGNSATVSSSTAQQQSFAESLSAPPDELSYVKKSRFLNNKGKGLSLLLRNSRKPKDLELPPTPGVSDMGPESAASSFHGSFADNNGDLSGLLQHKVSNASDLSSEGLFQLAADLKPKSEAKLQSAPKNKKKAGKSRPSFMNSLFGRGNANSRRGTSATVVELTMEEGEEGSESGGDSKPVKVESDAEKAAVLAQLAGNRGYQMEVLPSKRRTRRQSLEESVPDLPPQPPLTPSQSRKGKKSGPLKAREPASAADSESSEEEKGKNRGEKGGVFGKGHKTPERSSGRRSLEVQSGNSGYNLTPENLPEVRSSRRRSLGEVPRKDARQGVKVGPIEVQSRAKGGEKEGRTKRSSALEERQSPGVNKGPNEGISFGKFLGESPLVTPKGSGALNQREIFKASEREAGEGPVKGEKKEPKWFNKVLHRRTSAETSRNAWRENDVVGTSIPKAVPTSRRRASADILAEASRNDPERYRRTVAMAEDIGPRNPQSSRKSENFGQRRGRDATEPISSATGTESRTENQSKSTSASTKGGRRWSFTGFLGGRSRAEKAELELLDEGGTRSYRPSAVGSSKSKIVFHMVNILRKPLGSVDSEYEVLRGEELGRGKYGVIFKCLLRASGEEFACKVILKEKLTVSPGRKCSGCRWGGELSCLELS